MSTTPGEHDGQRQHDPPARALAEDGERDERDDDDLQVAEHGAQPGADVVDRVVPEDEVAGEEHAGDEREAGHARRGAAVRVPLAPGQQPEHGQGVRAAVDRRGLRPDRGEPDEDRRERDRQRPGDGRRQRGEAYGWPCAASSAPVPPRGSPDAVSH